MTKVDMYVQCVVQYPPFDNPSMIIKETVYIPKKFAIKNKDIIVDKPIKRKAKVIEVFPRSEKPINEIQKKKWNNNI